MTNDKIQMTKVGIIGAGNMGEALIKAGSVTAAADASEDRLLYLKKKYKIKIAESNRSLVESSNVIILAVKPQNMQEVLSEITPSVNNKKIIISIAAGVRTGFLEKNLGKVPVVRAMPNMPALIKKGISAICPGRFAKKSDLQKAKAVLSSVGKVVEVKEELMDAVTAISGSGPAYFFFLMEALTNIGKKHGLSEEAAAELAVQTAFGASSLALQTKQDPSILRQKVTSKGGATQAAFDVFKEQGLGKILQDGIEAAIKRAKFLGGKISCS